VRDVPLTEAIQSASILEDGAATSSARLDQELQSIGVQGPGIDIGPLSFGPPADLGPGPNISFDSARPSALLPAVDAVLPGGPSSPVVGVPEGRLASAAGSEPGEVQTTREVLDALEALVFVETVASRAHASPALADGAFNVLVTPPLQPHAPVKPLLVYSRRRFRHSRTPAVRDEAVVEAATTSSVATATIVAAPPQASPLIDTVASRTGPPRQPQRSYPRWMREWFYRLLRCIWPPPRTLWWPQVQALPRRLQRSSLRRPRVSPLLHLRLEWHSSTR
jgi:hypothetical protein